MFIIFIILLLMIAPGCYKVNTTNEFNKLQNRTKKITGASTILYNQDDCSREREITASSLDVHSSRMLTRNEAIGIALKHNPDLQADFENLGIAKADLEQAGLFTNPRIDSVFRIPTSTPGRGTAQTNIESTASFRLADLWQVPLSARVSEDLLEIVSLRILTTILDTIEETSFAYDTLLAAQASLKNVIDTLKEVREYRNEVYYRQKFGYSSDLDDYNADIMVEYLEIELIKHEKTLKTAYIHLRGQMGLEPTTTSLMAADNLYRKPYIPSRIELELYALEQRPEIQIASMKMKQYKDTISLEKTRIWTDVDLGVSFKQDFDKPFRGWGPYVAFDIPIFDTNYAQIARAQFLVKQAEKELRAATLHVKEELRTTYENLEAIQKELARYSDHIIPTHKKAIGWAFKYAETMQVNMLVAIQTRINLYEDTKKYIDTQYKLLHTFAELERAVGKQLTQAFTLEDINICSNEVKN